MKKILVADDEMHMTHILSYKLQKTGVDVITASDGAEAYALACQHRPDLVITDLQMPSMSGLEMATKLRENGDTSDIPVLMVTARGHRIALEELNRTNVLHLLPKPFSMRDLLARVEQILGPLVEGETLPAANVA